MSQLALDLIREAKEKRLTKLDLGNCGLTELPEELFELVWLEELILCAEGSIWNFQTEKFERFISQNKAEPNSISYLSPNIKNLKNLKTLIVRGSRSKYKLSDLSPLASLSNLFVLDVSLSEITDLTAIEGFPQLQALNVFSTEVNDLTPLKIMTQLKVLDISLLILQDLTPLQDLTQLKELYLSSTQVMDLTAIENLTKLEKLDISLTRISSLIPLRDMTQLKELSLSRTPIEDIGPIKKMLNLKKLSISSTIVGNLNPIKDMIKLEVLDISSTPVTNLEALRKLIQIKELYVSKTEIRDISPLRHLDQIEILNLDSTYIHDFNPLMRLKKIFRLNVFETQLKDLSPLKELFSLRELNAWSTQIISLYPLKDLIDLEHLHIAATLVADLSPIKKMSKLRFLNISSTKVGDLSSLKDLNKLENINFDSTQVSKIDTLRELKDLQYLSFGSTPVDNLIALKGLRKLKSLDLNNTNVSDLTPLEHLCDLNMLNISSTKINDLDALKHLTNLMSLEIFNLPLKMEIDLLNEMLIKNPSLNIYFDRGLLGIPEGLELNTKALREYLDALKEQNRSVKVILLGNTRSGKSQLVNYLISQSFNDKSDITPGVQIAEWEPNINGHKYQVLFYDFGGQDYYHATHNLYLDTQSLYLVLWHPQIIEKEQHMGLGYWLGNIDYFTDYAAEKNTAVWTLQTRSDDNSSGGIQSRISIDSALQKLYNVDTQGQFYLSVKGVFQDEPYWKLEWEYFKAHLEMKIIELTRDTQIIKETADVRDLVLPLLKEEGALVLTKEEFIEKVEAILKKKTTSNQATFTYLSAIGRILWFKDNKALEGYIFPDPAGLSSMIFEALENKSMETSNGAFSDHDLSETLKNKTYKNNKLIKKLFIDLLLEYQIIFERPEKKGNYVVPQNLPDQKLIRHLQELIPVSLVIRYEHYMPFWRISHFIAKKASKLESDAEYWKYGILYKDHNCKVLLKINRANFEKNKDATEQVNIHVTGPINGRIKILTELLIFFGEIHSPVNNSITSTSESNEINTEREINKLRFFNPKKAIKKIQLSVDGVAFFPVQELSEQIEKSKYMQNCDNVSEQIPSLFYPLFNQNRQMPKRVFFSYAHADAQYRRELEDHFAALKRSNLVETWHDMEIIPGENWDKRILEEIGKADIILGLISSDFMNSSYIWEKEIPKLEANNKTFIPVFLRPCYIEGSFIEELQGVPFDNQKKGKDQKSGIQWIVSSRWAYRDEAYLEVIKSLKMLLDKP